MLPPLLAWGLLARGLSCVFALSFVSIALQIRSLAGRRGIAPFASTLRQIRHDFPGHSAALYFPSLFWLTGTSDAALVLVPLGGAACALAAAAGMQSAYGEATILSWLAMRSLDLPIGLLYPWDSMLFEAGALAMLLPTPPLLRTAGAVGLATAPHPWVAGAFRWLLARVLLGFGKKKFAGTNSKHSCYIKHFLVAQPLPSPVGWFACRLPLPLFQFSLGVMFAVECVAPLLLLPSGDLRAVGALSIAALMLGIQLGGNFGYFNVLTIVLCLGALDTTSSVLDPLPPLLGAAAPTELPLRAALAAHTLLSLVFFPFDSWCTNAFGYWPQLAIAKKGWVRALLAVCRLVADHRLLHAYGVFPPDSNPPIRMAPLLEGSPDGGRTWRRYAWRYLPCDPTSAPKFVAPHHPRLDHSLFYTSFGTGPDNFLSTINSARPYAFGRDSMLQRLAHCLLSGASAEVRNLFGADPFPPTGPPPTLVRVRLMGYEPVSVVEAARTGVYWTEVCLDAVHMPPTGLEADVSGCAVGAGAADGNCGHRDDSGSGQPRRRRTSRDGRAAVNGGPAAAAASLGAEKPPSRVAVAAPPLPPPLAPGSRDPLLFHPDLLVVWRTRCPKLRRLLDARLDLPSSPRQRSTRTLAHIFARLCVSDYRAWRASYQEFGEIADTFWEVFVPAVANCPLRRWDGDPELPGGLPAMAAELEAAFTPAERHGFELILGGLTMRMLVTLEGLHHERKLHKLGGAAPSYFHLVLLAHALILRGPHAASAVLDDDCHDACEVELEEVMQKGLSFLGVLWSETMLFHARKHIVQGEMMRKYSDNPLRHKHPCLIPGWLTIVPTVADALMRRVGDGQQSFPQWEPPGPWGDWRRVTTC